jgi:hypothetical protein
VLEESLDPTGVRLMRHERAGAVAQGVEAQDPQIGGSGGSLEPSAKDSAIERTAKRLQNT